MYICMYVSHVLDRQFLPHPMSPSPKLQVMFASARIGDFWDSYFLSYGEFVELINMHAMKLRVVEPCGQRSRATRA